MKTGDAATAVVDARKVHEHGRTHVCSLSDSHGTLIWFGQAVILGHVTKVTAGTGGAGQLLFLVSRTSPRQIAELCGSTAGLRGCRLFRPRQRRCKPDPKCHRALHPDLVDR